MKKLTLGVFFDDNLHSGGSFQQSLNNVILVNKLASPELEIKIITTQKRNLELLKDLDIESFLYKPNFISRTWMYIRENSPLKFYDFIKLFEKKNNLEKFLKRLNIDLVYFVSQNGYVDFLQSINFIYTLFDLCHRDFPEFPEVNTNRIFERRENILKKNLTRSVAILVDSELGKKNLMLRYQTDSERIHVCPFNYSSLIEQTYSKALAQRSTNLNIKEKYELKCDYLFYPAQFWSHKNHVYILKALSILEKKENIRVGAIFCGSDRGNLSYIKDMTENLNLTDRVRFIGFAPNELMPNLYKQSLALVMPTYFGPTNLPPLEAFKYNTPVMYSDLPGLKEQVKDAALLLNLNKPESLSNNIKILLNSNKLRKDLTQKGNDLLKTLDQSQNHLSILKKIIEMYKIKRSCWS